MKYSFSCLLLFIVLITSSFRLLIESGTSSDFREYHPLNRKEYLSHNRIRTVIGLTKLKKGIYGYGRNVSVFGEKYYKTEQREFDVLGNLTQEYQFLSEGPLINNYKFTYDRKGKIISRIESFVYTEFIRKYYYSDSVPEVVDSITLYERSIFQMDTLTTREGVINYGYYDGKLQRKEFLFKDSLIEFVEYDYYDRKIKSCYNGRGNESIKIDYYNNAQQIYRSELPESIIEYEYDNKLLNEIRNISKLGIEILKFEYDENGLLLKELYTKGINSINEIEYYYELHE